MRDAHWNDRLDVHSVDGHHWLIFIKNQERICQLRSQHEIFRITEILIQPFDNFDEVIPCECLSKEITSFRNPKAKALLH